MAKQLGLMTEALNKSQARIAELEDELEDRDEELSMIFACREDSL